MRTFAKLLFGLSVFAMTGYAFAQPPGGRGRGGGGGGISPVDRMMMMDANGDDQLTPDEVTDDRVKNMLYRADSNQDGVVTRAELTVMAEQFAGGGNARGRGGAMRGGMMQEGGPGGGPGGGGPGGGGPGGAGPGGPPPIGQIMPPFAAEELQLTSAQQAAIAELQAYVDSKLADILTDEQEQQIADGQSNLQRGGPPGGGNQRGANQRGQGRQRIGR
ncbi:MAG: hypothetical protein ACF8CQ_13010 [Rhodopirellula sp. JB044]|uniref:hypothetical protein n=1 Tax=Rhodopirellula sp. JB044 TaxID=3342844 RepID=UPI00370A5428